MALTTKDKAWVRRMIREEIGSLLAEVAATQVGGYDGATAVVDDDGAEEGRARKIARPIGFHVIAAAHAAQVKARKR